MQNERPGLQAIPPCLAFCTGYGACLGALYGVGLLLLWGGADSESLAAALILLGFFGMLGGAFGGTVTGALAGLCIAVAGIRPGALLGFGLGGIVGGILAAGLYVPPPPLDPQWHGWPAAIAGVLGMLVGLLLPTQVGCLPGLPALRRALAGPPAQE